MVIFVPRQVQNLPSTSSNQSTMSVTLHTSHGDLKVEVYCDLTPRTAENFLALCACGYYNETVFHRNMKGFMIQGGDPSGKGKGGVGGGYPCNLNAEGL